MWFKLEYVLVCLIPNIPNIFIYDKQQKVKE